MPRFKDAPLGKDLFRLFRFDHSKADLEIEVKTFKIYRAPKYEAISYCWGEKSDGVHTITSNGESLEVWSNLYAALQRFWREDEGVKHWYWNDAICIEQGDSDVAATEKARQIAFMEVIFRLAEPVKVWLGDASDEEERVLEQMAHTMDSTPHGDIEAIEAKLPPPNDGAWLLWSQILLRPWFARLWIVQEALISAGNVIVTLGKRAHMSWVDFVRMHEKIRAGAWLNEVLEYDQLDRRAQQAVKRDFALDWGTDIDSVQGQKRQELSNSAFEGCLVRNIVNLNELLQLEKYHDPDFGFLGQVLKVFGNRRCAYDQDRPNAMRGVLTDELKKGLKVYDIHADVATVYREVTRTWLSRDPLLSLLHRIRPLARYLPAEKAVLATKVKNPSWVIDLSCVATQVVGDGIPHRVDGFHAGLVQTTSLRGKTEWAVPKARLMSSILGSKHVTFPSENECHISGVQVGIVKDVLASRQYPKRVAIQGKRNPAMDEQWKIQRLGESLHLVQSVVSDAQAAEETHWRTLVMNATHTADPDVRTAFDVDNQHSRLTAYHRTVSIVETGDRDQLIKADDATRSFWSEAQGSQGTFPVWFSTSTDHVGRSFAVPEAGDVVAIFYGAATPFLLRPMSDRDVFEFMGEAYVHGVMQGEALLEPAKTKYPKCIFKLV